MSASRFFVSISLFLLSASTAGNASAATGSAGSTPASGSSTSSPTSTPADLTQSIATLNQWANQLGGSLEGERSLALLGQLAATAQPVANGATTPGAGGSSTSVSSAPGSGTSADTAPGSGAATGGGNGTGVTAGSIPTVSTADTYSVQNGLLYKHSAGGFTYVVGPPASFMQQNVTYYANKTSFYVLQGNSMVYVGQYENPYRQLDLRQPTTMTAAQISAYLEANDPLSPLIALVPVYLQAQQQYGVNAQYLVAHSIIESTWGQSQIAHDKNNLFGYSAFDASPYASATMFPSKAYAILYEAWFVRKDYLDSSGAYYHGPNLDGMNVDYATDPNWAESIAAVMWNMQAFAAAQGAAANPLPEASSPPVFAYPAGVTGQVTTSGLHVRQGPGLGYGIIGQFANGSTVNVTGWVPGWYQVQDAAEQAFVSSQYVTLSNLGEIAVDGVNLRAGPSTSASVVGHLNTADEVELLGTSQDDQWVRVETMTDVTGYVYSPYVTRLS